MNPISSPDTLSQTTKQLKVWHVVCPMNRGGAEVMIMELLRHKSPETQVDFLVHQYQDHVSGTADFDAEILELGGRLLPIVTPVQSGMALYFRRFRQLIEIYGRPDVIHSHLNARSGLVALAAWRHGIPRIIVHSHAHLTFRGSLGYRMLARTELFFSKLVFAAVASDFWGCSEAAVRSLFPSWSSRGQPRVIINNAIDTNAFEALSAETVERVRADLVRGKGGVLIGTVGRIVRHKNFAMLIDVLYSLKVRGVMANLIIVGREEDSEYVCEILARAADLGLSDDVYMVGARDDIPAVMTALDVFVSPALREGFGLVGLEAQAAGTPCVLSEGYPKTIDLDLGLVQWPDGFDPDTWASAVLASLTVTKINSVDVTRAVANRGFSAPENTRRIEHAWRDRAFIPGALL